MRSQLTEAERGPKLLAKFNPNSKPLPKPKWATYAPFRSPSWKIHSNIGHAKNAVACHDWIIRYEWDEGHALSGEPSGWVEIERKEGRSR